MLKNIPTRKILLITLPVIFSASVYFYVKTLPWPEKYLFLFKKNEYFFEMPTFKKDCNISDFGAIEGGESSNTEAFHKAITQCAQDGGGNVIVPKGTWLTGAIQLKSNINLKLEKGSVVLFSKKFDDYLPMVQTRWEGIELFNYSPFIYAKDAKNVSITGTGKFIGQGDAWDDWKRLQDNAFLRLYAQADERKPVSERIFGTEQDALRPSFVQFFNCQNILLEDFSIEDGPMWTIHTVFSENITAENLKITALGSNSDGFVIDSSRNVVLNKLRITSGDDAISIKSGLEPDIWNRDVPSENIIIKNSTIRQGHAGVAIGSEMSGGVSDVRIENNYFTKLDWAIRIKSVRGRGGLIQNISAKDLKIENVNQIIAVDLDYQGATLVPLKQDPPRAKNITMENVSGKLINEFVFLNGLPDSPLQNIEFKNINIETKGMSKIINSENISFTDLIIRNIKDKDILIKDSRKVLFSDATICQKKSSNCVLIDGKDNDGIHFKQANVSLKNIDFGESVDKKTVTISD